MCRGSSEWGGCPLKEASLNLESADVRLERPFQPGHRYDHLVLDLGPAIFVQVSADDPLGDPARTLAIKALPLELLAKRRLDLEAVGLEPIEDRLVLVLGVAAAVDVELCRRIDEGSGRGQPAGLVSGGSPDRLTAADGRIATSG